MSWLARLRGDDEPDEQEPPEPDEDSPEALQAAIDELVRFVNARAGGLPPAALANARGSCGSRNSGGRGRTSCTLNTLTPKS